jgi:hypothetical protein
MKISVSGKGGSGKTTVAGTLARSLARSGLPVLAIDGDSNPNLGLTLGVPADSLAALPELPFVDLLEEVQGRGWAASVQADHGTGGGRGALWEPDPGWRAAVVYEAHRPCRQGLMVPRTCYRA